jgi:DNA-binding transcriptional ArsR family regulator
MADARLFQALSDPTRLKIVALLAGGPLNVTRIVDRVHVAQPAVSRHLRILREVGLIKDKRLGKEVEYSLQPGRVMEMSVWLEDIGATEGEGTSGPQQAPPGGGPKVRRISPLQARRGVGLSRPASETGVPKEATGPAPEEPAGQDAKEAPSPPEFTWKRPASRRSKGAGIKSRRGRRGKGRLQKPRGRAASPEPMPRAQAERETSYVIHRDDDEAMDEFLL